MILKNDIILSQDINLLEFPFWTIENRENDHSFVVETNQGKYSFFALPELVPNHKDALFLYVLLYMAQETNTNVIEFNAHQFLKDLGIGINQKNYDALQQSLRKFKSCSMEFENCFVERHDVVKNGEVVQVTKYTDKGFGILKYERVSLEKIYQGQKKRYKKHDYKVIFDDTFIQVIQDSSWTINLNLRIFGALQDPVKRRFFEWIPKQLLGRKQFTLSDRLLFPKLLIKRPKYMSLVERKLKTYQKKIEQLNNHVPFYNYSLNWVKREKDFKLTFSKTNKPKEKQKSLFETENSTDFAKIAYDLELLGFFKPEEYSRKLATKEDWDLAFADLNFTREQKERKNEAFNAGGWFRAIVDSNYKRNGTKYVPTADYKQHLADCEKLKKQQQKAKQDAEKSKIFELEKKFDKDRAIKAIKIIEKFTKEQSRAEQKEFEEFINSTNTFLKKRYNKLKIKGQVDTMADYKTFIGNKYLEPHDKDFILWAEKYHEQAVIKNNKTNEYEFKS